MKSIPAIYASAARAGARMLPEWLRLAVGRRRVLGAASDFSRQEEEALYRSLCAGFDAEAFRSRWEAFRADPGADPTDAEKYFNHAWWLRRSLWEAARLGLHQPPGRRVLDLGCGPGWFLRTAGHLGHDATGLDLPLSMMREGDRPVYETICDSLGCSDRIVRFAIEPFKPLPLQGPFDLISAFLVCFDGQWEETPWGVPEWEFFLADIERLMPEGGVLDMQLNANAKLHPELIYYDRDTLRLFSERGTVSRSRVRIRLGT